MNALNFTPLMLIYFFIEAVCYIISTLYFLRLIECFLPLKESKYKKVLAYVGISLVCNVIIYNYDAINISYTMMLFICIMTFCFQGDILKKISVVMVIYPIVVALNFMTISLFTFINVNFDTISNLGTCIFWVITYKAFNKRISKSIKLINNKTWLLIDTICLAPFISIFLTLINTPSRKLTPAYFTSIACIITSLGILVLIEYIINSVKTDMENQNLKLEYSYYRELEENQLELRKLRHDMNNHLSVIYSFLENKNVTDAKSYFSSLSNKFKVTIRTFCGNSLVNAVINSKYNLAMENQIDCFFNIDINTLLPIEDIDLCSIFANTLDNALEASKKISEPSHRKITVKARCHNGYFSYSVNNHLCIEPIITDGKYISNKDDKKMHGYGIENVKAIVDKYSGTISLTHDQNEFSVLIAIPI